MQSFLHFLKYNNVIPISFTILMLGSASAYAAANPEVILDETETVIAIDNTYIVNVDLREYSPTVRILSVTEDEEYYYIVYEFTTIELYEAVWQDITIEETMRVSKGGLGAYRDLGLYVTEQLNQKIDQELRRLKETQVIERTQLSQKQVATAYSGLVGAFLNETTETVPGYEPLVVPPEPEAERETFARPDPNAKPPKVEKPEEIEEPEDPVTVPPEEVENRRPRITILGDNPARVPLNGTYTDLGATVSDDHDTSLTIELYLDDAAVSSIALDTSAVRTYTITYFVEDSGGRTSAETRAVEVYDPDAPIVTEPDPEEPEGGNDGGGGGEDPAPTTPELPEEEPATTTPEVPKEEVTPTPLPEEESEAPAISEEEPQAPEDTVQETPVETSNETAPESGAVNGGA